MDQELALAKELGHDQQQALETVHHNHSISTFPSKSSLGVDATLMIVSARKLLYTGSMKDRNTTRGIQALLEMERIIDQASPSHAYERLPFPLPQPQPEGNNSAQTDEKRLIAKQMELLGSEGMNSATQAAFDLSIFQLLVTEDKEILDVHVDDTTPRRSAMVRLHKASYLGSLEATLALANRFSFGLQGAPVNEELAILYSRAAATLIVANVEKSTSSSPETPVSLHERWGDQWHVPPSIAEGPRLRAMDEDLAHRGNAAARGRLAYRRLVGQGGEVADPDEARAMWQLAEAGGDFMGAFNLGYLALTGKAGKENHTLARLKFEEAAIKGKVPQAFQALGSMAWEGKGLLGDGEGEGLPNMTLAVEWFERGLVYNCSECAFNLGVLNLHGVSSLLEANATRAYSLFLLADQLGAWKAAFTLADLTSEGKGCEKNLTLALSYFRKFFRSKTDWNNQVNEAVEALDRGDVFGSMFRLFQLAEQGSGLAALNLAWILRRKEYDQMTDPEQSSQRPPLSQGQASALARHRWALRLMRQASMVEGCIPCFVQLAQALLQEAEFIKLTSQGAGDGYPVAQLQEEAVSCLEQAVKEGDRLLSLRISGPQNISIIESFFVLGSVYQQGIGVKQNSSRAKELYLKAFRISLKHQFPRAVAPFMGLLSLQIDENLHKLLGPGITHRFISWIRLRIIVPLALGDNLTKQAKLPLDDLVLAIFVGALGITLSVKMLHR